MSTYEVVAYELMKVTYEIEADSREEAYEFANGVLDGEWQMVDIKLQYSNTDLDTLREANPIHPYFRR